MFAPMRPYLPLLFPVLASLGCGSATPAADAAVIQDAAAVSDRGPTPDAPSTTADASRDAGAQDPCQGLGELCHEVDPGSGPLHDCHEGGHDGNPAWCAANAARCRMLCLAAADAGVASDGGHRHADAAGDAHHH